MQNKPEPSGWDESQINIIDDLRKLQERMLAQTGLERSEEVPRSFVIAMMEEMTDEERLEIMNHFCKACGCIQPEGSRCQCWNDE